MRNFSVDPCFPEFHSDNQKNRVHRSILLDDLQLGNGRGHLRSHHKSLFKEVSY